MDAVPDSPDTRIEHPKSEYFNVPVYRDGAVVERPARQETITRRYVEESLRFIRANRNRPFFLYLAHTMPHVPLFAGEGFAGRSPRGAYGDVVEEIDGLPTLAAVAGVPLPAGRVLDGYDLSPVLRGGGPSPRRTYFYYRSATLQAVRSGPYKLHFLTRPDGNDEPPRRVDPPWLFD